MRYTTCPWFRACDRHALKSLPKTSPMPAPCRGCVEGRARRWEDETDPGLGCSFSISMGSGFLKVPAGKGTQS